MTDKKIHISTFDLNSRERILNTENELKFQRLELDKLTKLSSDFDKQIDHIKKVIKSFSNFTVRSSKAINKLENRAEELSKCYDEIVDAMKSMEDIRAELETYLTKAKIAALKTKLKAEIDSKKTIKPKEPILTRIKNLEKYKWMLWGGFTVVIWIITLAVKEVGLTKILALIGISI